ncbi:hypothetical protein ACLMJV_14990 [Sinorhizobium meliloti]|uniref:hypothetical protein n=1 Tax=Rhizobium meliloti TaxID=382 RepID=UPI00398D0EBA
MTSFVRGDLSVAASGISEMSLPSGRRRRHFHAGVTCRGDPVTPSFVDATIRYWFRG